MFKSLIAVSVLLFTNFALAGDCRDMVYGAEFPQTAEASVVLCKREFVIGYSWSRRSALWVAMLLDPEKITRPNAIDNLPFKPDPAISPNEQAALVDYVGSGYDRGHMAAFEDVNHDALAAADSMMLTNVIPQSASNNRGIWRVLESRIREASLSGKLFVISGPIYISPVKTIGPNNIMVPSGLFKIVINPRTRTAVTYVLPNSAIPAADLEKYIVPRSEVTRLTGIELVPAVILTDKK